MIKNRIIVVGPLCTKKNILEELTALNLDQSTDFLIAIDGGLNILNKLKIRPNFSIGDWDSLENSKKNLSEILNFKTLEKEKSLSDFAATLDWIKKNKNCPNAEIHLFGLFGARSDHFYSNIEEIKRFISNKNVEIQKIQLYSSSDFFIFFKNQNRKKITRLNIDTTPNSFFSIFNISRAKFILSNVKFKIPGHQQLLRPSHGLSNVSVKNTIQIKLINGVILYIGRRK